MHTARSYRVQVSVHLPQTEMKTMAQTHRGEQTQPDNRINTEPSEPPLLPSSRPSLLCPSVCLTGDLHHFCFFITTCHLSLLSSPSLQLVPLRHQTLRTSPPCVRTLRSTSLLTEDPFLSFLVTQDLHIKVSSVCRQPQTHSLSLEHKSGPFIHRIERSGSDQ